MNQPVIVRCGPVERRLRHGERLTFGRFCAPRVGTDTHLGLSDSTTLHARAGSLTVDDAGCLLTNTGRWLRLRVVHLDGAERTDLDPGRSVRIPWARSRVEVATGDEVLGIELLIPQAGSPAAPPVSPADDTIRGLGLDRCAGYFRALVALCEPRLCDPGSDAVAAAGEIARRLNGSGREQTRVTPKAVERRLANVRVRLGIGGQEQFGGSAAGLEVRDASRQLVDLVLRTGTVTAADLELLDPPGGP